MNPDPKHPSTVSRGIRHLLEPTGTAKLFFLGGADLACIVSVFVMGGEFRANSEVFLFGKD